MIYLSRHTLGRGTSAFTLDLSAGASVLAVMPSPFGDATLLIAEDDGGETVPRRFELRPACGALRPDDWRLVGCVFSGVRQEHLVLLEERPYRDGLPPDGARIGGENEVRLLRDELSYYRGRVQVLEAKVKDLEQQAHINGKLCDD